MRTSPRCAGFIKPKTKRKTKSGLQRYPEVQGDLGTQRCLKSINCPHHRADNARIVELPFDEHIPLTRDQVRAAINEGHMEVTGRPFYQDREES